LTFSSGTRDFFINKDLSDQKIIITNQSKKNIDYLFVFHLFVTTFYPIVEGFFVITSILIIFETL